MRRGSLPNSIGGRLSATTETTTTTTTITTTVTSTTTTKTRLRVSRHMDLDKGAESERATSWTSDIVRQEVEGAPPPNALRRTWRQMPANRETAFVEAVTSAAITHTLTKNCSTGEFSDCGCDARMTKRRELSPRNYPVWR